MLWTTNTPPTPHTYQLQENAKQNLHKYFVLYSMGAMGNLVVIF